MKLDIIMFNVFPYIAVSIALSVSIFRYFTNSYKFSSLSSEFLEGRKLFWGSVPWHYGILTVLFGHLFAFLFPQSFIAFNSVPMRLVILEVTSLVFGLMSLFGLILLIKRRTEDARIAAVTRHADMLVLFLLLIQVGTGLATAIFYRWGNAWYATAMVPYLRSLFMFSPELGYVTPLPFNVKIHIFNAMVIIAVLPFTRLLHFLILPIQYIWRAKQVVIWNWDRKTIRK